MNSSSKYEISLYKYSYMLKHNLFTKRIHFSFQEDNLDLKLIKKEVEVLLVQQNDTSVAVSTKFVDRNIYWTYNFEEFHLDWRYRNNF